MLYLSCGGFHLPVKKIAGGWQVDQFCVIGRKCDCGEKSCKHVAALVNAGLIAGRKYRRPWNCVDAAAMIG